MSDREALLVYLSDGWVLHAAGVRRERSGDLAADVVLQNGDRLHADRVALNRAESRDAFVATVTRDGWPDPRIVADGLHRLLPEALAQVQEPAEQRQSQADLLVALAAEAELFHDPAGDCYATIPVGGHRETHRLRTRGFRQWLARRFHEAYERTPGSQAMQDALAVLEGQALFDGPERPVFVRLAEHEGTIYLDLADAEWRAVEIDGDGWRVVADPPVRFRRAAGMLPLPVPEPGGSLNDLRALLNVGDEDWYLVVAWLVQALRPTGPYPVLVVNGEQGSAKTTLSRMLRALVDPNTAPVRSEPREVRDLMIAAANGWVLGFDNLSHIGGWLSDALCRLSTGGGFSTRALYANDEEQLFDAQRPVILNGITDLATRPDLLDRALLLNLPSIPDARRRPEVEVWTDFQLLAPGILGALCDAVSAALANISVIQLDRLPRMADFALWVSAAEHALGWETGTFLEVYSENRQFADAIARDADPVADALLDYLDEVTSWSGTAAELLAALNERQDEDKRKPLERAKVWPTTPRALSGALRRLAPVLQRAGLVVAFDREAGSGRRIIQLEREGKQPSQPSQPSQPGKKPHADAETGCDGGCDGCDAAPNHRHSDRHTQKPHADAENESGCDGCDGCDGAMQSYSDRGTPRCSGCGRQIIGVVNESGLCGECKKRRLGL